MPSKKKQSNTTTTSPPYKCVEVVRKHDERKKLPTWSCWECENVRFTCYKYLEQNLFYVILRKISAYYVIRKKIITKIVKHEKSRKYKCI